MRTKLATQVRSTVPSSRRGTRLLTPVRGLAGGRALANASTSGKARLVPDSGRYLARYNSQSVDPCL